MNTLGAQPKPQSNWKRLAIVAFSCGAGFALMASLILWGIAWYKSRPTSPKPWIRTIVTATGAPGFSVSDDGKILELTYALQNTGGRDFRIDSLSDIDLMVRSKDGTFGGPLSGADQRIHLPFFVPARQKAFLKLSLVLPDLPTRGNGESDADFHEQVRKRIEQKYGNLGGFTIFDSAYRYQIDLPKWLAEAPKGQTP